MIGGYNMNTRQDYRFWVSLSKQQYDHKPDRETEVGKITFGRAYPTVNEFASRIAKGYCYTPIFASATFGISDKTDNNYRYSSFISLDIDHSQVDMNTMVDGLEYKPTFSYTSCSNGKDGKYSYRLVYCFDDKIEGTGEYSNYVHTILNANQIPVGDIDKHSLKASQLYFGNGCGNIDIKVSHIIYNKQDFTSYYKDYNTSNDNESINLTHNTNNTHHPTIMSYSDTFIDKQFADDYWNMKMEDILVKYVDIYPNIEHTPLPVVDDDTPYILFPADYCEIKRYWRVNDDGRATKIKDGEGRRRKLFFNGILRRLITPSISFDNLIYNLLFELVYYISNYKAEYVIDKKDIFHIAKNVMNADMTRYEGLKGTDRRFMVNPRYCQKYSLNKKQVRNIACKLLRNQHIGELYDCARTDKENLAIMQEHGLDVSLITLKRWRKENGITKYRKNAS